MAGSISSERSARMRATVPSSSAPTRRLYPTTSAGVYRCEFPGLGHDCPSATSQISTNTLKKCPTATVSGCRLTPSPIRSPSLFLDNVAQMDADAKLDAAFGRQAGVALNHAVLHFDAAAHGIHDAAELMRTPSPVRFTTRPLCTAMVGSIRSLRSARSRARVRSSSAPW